MADVGLAVERAKDKTQQMQARADAVDELTAAGTLERLHLAGDDIDRQLSQIQQSGQVDDELAKLKAELGQGRRGARSSHRPTRPPPRRAARGARAGRLAVRRQSTEASERRGTG